MLRERNWTQKSPFKGSLATGKTNQKKTVLAYGESEDRLEKNKREPGVMEMFCILVGVLVLCITNIHQMFHIHIHQNSFSYIDLGSMHFSV